MVEPISSEEHPYELKSRQLIEDKEVYMKTKRECVRGEGGGVACNKK